MQQPSSETEDCLSQNFRQIVLTPTAQDFLRDSLDGWKTLSELVLKETDFNGGRLFIPASPESDSPVPDFKYGGEGESAMGEYVTRLEQIIKAFLNETDGLVVFHNTTANRGDFWIKEEEHNGWFAYWNDEVYQIMHRGKLALVPAYAWDVTGSHFYRGYFCRYDGQSISGEELSHEVLSACSRNVAAVVVDAFDFNGYLLWYR